MLKCVFNPVRKYYQIKHFHNFHAYQGKTRQARAKYKNFFIDKNGES